MNIMHNASVLVYSFWKVMSIWGTKHFWLFLFNMMKSISSGIFAKLTGDERSENRYKEDVK